MPGGTTRYLIGTADLQEEQRSSGIWISTPIGSDGGIRLPAGKSCRSARVASNTRFVNFTANPVGVIGWCTATYAMRKMVIASKMPEANFISMGRGPVMHSIWDARGDRGFPGRSADLSRTSKDGTAFSNRAGEHGLAPPMINKFSRRGEAMPRPYLP